MEQFHLFIGFAQTGPSNLMILAAASAKENLTYFPKPDHVYSIKGCSALKGFNFPKEIDDLLCDLFSRKYSSDKPSGPFNSFIISFDANDVTAIGLLTAQALSDVKYKIILSTLISINNPLAKMVREIKQLVGVDCKLNEVPMSLFYPEELVKNTDNNEEFVPDGDEIQA